MSCPLLSSFVLSCICFLLGILGEVPEIEISVSKYFLKITYAIKFGTLTFFLLLFYDNCSSVQWLWSWHLHTPFKYLDTPGLCFMKQQWACLLTMSPCKCDHEIKGRENSAWLGMNLISHLEIYIIVYRVPCATRVTLPMLCNLHALHVTSNPP